MEGFFIAININDPIATIPGVGAARAKALRAMGIETIEDLLRTYPRDYDDRSQVKTVAMLTPDAVNTIRGFILAEPENVAFPSKKDPSKPLIMTKARFRDETGVLELVWFNQPYLKKYFKKESEYIFTGKVKVSYNRIQMESPEYAVWDKNSLSGGRIVPVYTVAKSIPQKLYRSYIHTALSHVGAKLAEYLPHAVRKKYSLCDITTAAQHIHFPESDALFLRARRRLVFEELFFMQLALLRLKGAAANEPGIIFKDADILPFLQILPYSLTGPQEAVLADITCDMQSGRRMNRLVQGDVGSGKTAMAMGAVYLAVKNGFQAAVMAPTEVLAGQHFTQFSKYLAGYETVLLTGSLTAKKRRMVLADIQSGKACIIIGTHALFQPGVEYHSLGLVITDEQHRFGVNQRLALREKGEKPHTLIMTATPIPRTLGLILYGDMDISVIDELPPGRREIKTYCVPSGYRERIRGFIRREAEQGRQSYVICPAIGETGGSLPRLDSVSPDSSVTNVLTYTADLKSTLPNISICCLHGRMKPADKKQIMADFKAGSIQVIVSTTVIEVGVHVANATLMVIEDADRFGLSQLHQLRGRVGRGDTQSYCVLVTDSKNKVTQKRMKAICETTDGFRLSEMDMELRGAGDFFGTRQHGLPEFTIANLYRDISILKEAQEAAVAVFRGQAIIEESERENCLRRISDFLNKACHVGVM